MCGSVGCIHEPKRKTKLSPQDCCWALRNDHGYRLLHLRTCKLVEARYVRFREDITVIIQYTSSLLKGQQASYKQIMFAPLPVEYVTTESSRKEAAHTVTDNLPEDAEPSAGSSTSFGGGVSSSNSSSGKSLKLKMRRCRKRGRMLYQEKQTQFRHKRMGPMNCRQRNNNN